MIYDLKIYRFENLKIKDVASAKKPSWFKCKLEMPIFV